MRKLWLGSTALISALAIAPAAQAEMEVVMGGYVSTQVGIFDNDQPNNADRDFRSKSEIRINAKGTADNGLEYGARVDLLASTNLTSNARRTGIFAQGRYGRVEFGDLDGASNNLSVLGPTVGIGQLNGSYVNFIPTTSRPAGSVVDTGGGMIRGMDSDQATKVTYYTPRLSGFQAGVSYVPEVDSQEDGEQVQFSNTAGNQRDMFELGLNYRNTYSNGVRVRAGATYDMAQAKDTSGREDISAWGLGLRVGYQGFELGGAYVDNGDSNNALGIANDNETAFHVSGRYERGPWGVALSYINEDYDANGGRGLDTAGGTYNAFVIGGAYKIANGLSAGADLAFFERNKDTGTDDNGYVMVVETRASF